MTPADLAELLKTTAAAVLAEHDLDTSALPATVTVERPRNPEHGDYATNLALQLGKKVGVNPRELAGWLATALADADGIASADVAGPGFVNLRIDASAQGVIVNNVLDAGKNYGHPTRSAARTSTWSSSPPTRPARSTSAAPAGPLSATRSAGCCRPRAPKGRGSTTSTTTAPDRPVHQLADRGRQGRADARRRLRAATTSATSPPRCSPRSPTRCACPTPRCARRSAPSAST